MDLFNNQDHESGAVVTPLADRMRPKLLDEMIGQSHLIGPGKVLREMVTKDMLISMILWGPPGVGKTTLANVIASETRASFLPVSAVAAGVKEIRKAIDQAKVNRKGLGKRTILFIDEIHRFNKAQQDALLHSVEDGTLILIGATTENPSFEVIGPLLSRCRVYQMESLKDDDILNILDRALQKDEILQKISIDISDEVKALLVRLSGGDARITLNTLEVCSKLTREDSGKRRITSEIVQEAIQKRIVRYDKAGDSHYDTISAFIKSMRGSDPDAAVYWLARMLEAGEDPLFIARRMIILASEDVGNSDPNALVVANAAFQAVHAIGMPEARIVLSQAATYLASAPKSNASYMAVTKATEDVRKLPLEPVPLHIRNAPTSLMKDIGYGKDYKYAHDHDNGFVEQDYLPPGLKNQIYYHPKDIGEEKKIKDRLKMLWPKRRTEE
jgi:putative ATPase